MRGIKSDALSAIVEFLYHGEVCIRQEDLNNFLVLAEELKLKGIVGRRGDYDKLNIEKKYANKMLYQVKKEIAIKSLKNIRQKKQIMKLLHQNMMTLVMEKL